MLTMERQLKCVLYQEFASAFHFKSNLFHKVVRQILNREATTKVYTGWWSLVRTNCTCAAVSLLSTIMYLCRWVGENLQHMQKVCIAHVSLQSIRLSAVDNLVVFTASIMQTSLASKPNAALISVVIRATRHTG